MKKNDFATVIAYVAMFAVAILMGLLAIKPVIDEFGQTINGQINTIMLVILSLVAGIVFNALLLEYGHRLGARMGKMTVTAFAVFGFGWKRVDGKKKIGFHSYNGLTGETKVIPQDPKTSTFSGMIFLPILGFIVEVIVMMVLKTVAQRGGATMAWLQVFSLTFLAVGIMIFVYDIFPVRIDSITDGFLLTLTSKPANRYAYNNMLLEEYAKENGLEVPAPVIYDEISDFTAFLNLVQAVKMQVEGKSKEAEAILNKTLDPETKVTSTTYGEAMAYKLALLLERKDKKAGKGYYEGLDDDERRYIANLSSPAALRCYVLISAFIENSENECNYALDKTERVLRGCASELLEYEKALIDAEVKEIRSEHISWDVYPLPWEEQPKLPEEEEKETEEAEDEEEK